MLRLRRKLGLFNRPNKHYAPAKEHIIHKQTILILLVNPAALIKDDDLRLLKSYCASDSCDGHNSIVHSPTYSAQMSSVRHHSCSQLSWTHLDVVSFMSQVLTHPFYDAVPSFIHWERSA